MDGDVFPNLWRQEILGNYNGDGEKHKGCGESLIQIQLGDHFLTSICSHPWLWTEVGWGSGGTLYTGGGEVGTGSFQWVASKETTQLLFRCYQLGKWVKKTVLENVFLRQ